MSNGLALTDDICSFVKRAQMLLGERCCLHNAILARVSHLQLALAFKYTPLLHECNTNTPNLEISASLLILDVTFPCSFMLVRETDLLSDCLYQLRLPSTPRMEYPPLDNLLHLGSYFNNLT